MKTKLCSIQIEHVRRRCGFNFGIDVLVYGIRGGLYFGWHDEIKISLRRYSNKYITVDVLEDDTSI